MKFKHITCCPFVFAFMLLMCCPTSVCSAEGSQESSYGEELSIIGTLGIGPCMDAAVSGNHLYVIGCGALKIFDISDPQKPQAKGFLSVLGNTRQIAVANHVAYVVSRENGLYIIDVSSPDLPVLLAHYDTMEFATGIAVEGTLVAVANRGFGVELLDVSDPVHPRHITRVASGESQSVCFDGTMLYAGIWGAGRVSVIDCADPNAPKELTTIDLDGFGDGVLVRDSVLYAATGHHSKKFSGEHSESGATAPGYGEGHGLEAYDISNPASPGFLSRVKNPRLYGGFPDTWTLEVAGDYAFVADTQNGIFVINIKNPQAMQHAARAVLPWQKALNANYPVGGLAVGDGVIYVAGAYSDLYIVDAKKYAKIEEKPAPRAFTSPAAKGEYGILQDEGWTVYKPGGQIRSAAVIDDSHVLVAVGNQGLHLLQISPEVKVIQTIETKGIATDVAVRGGVAACAEEYEGLSTWSVSPEGLSFTGRYIAKNPSTNYSDKLQQSDVLPVSAVRQVVLPAGSNYALIQSGYNFEILSIENPESIESVLFYGKRGFTDKKEIPAALLGGSLSAMFWNASGPVWFDLSSSPPKMITNEIRKPRGVRAILVAPDGSKALVFYKNGYEIITEDMARKNVSLDGLPSYKPGKEMNVKTATIYGTTVYAAHHGINRIDVLDCSDLTHPKLLSRFSTRGTPYAPVKCGELLLIPDGYAGLRIGTIPGQ
jgi:hypothetical protein